MRFNCLIATALLTIAMYPVTGADAANASNTNAGEGICRTFVQSFYTWYLKQPNSARAYKNRKNSFSPELFKALNDDYAASQKVSGEIVGLDFDPFLSTNAEPHAKYVASKVTKKGNNYLVQVDGSGGNRTDHTVIVPEVACEDGKCQFVNFHYPQSKPPDDSLMSILKMLADDRRKQGIK